MLGKRGGINANDVEDAVEPLRKAVQKDTDAKVRAAAARALGNIHVNAHTNVPALIDRLKNDEKMDVKTCYCGGAGSIRAPTRRMHCRRCETWPRNSTPRNPRTARPS